MAISDVLNKLNSLGLERRDKETDAAIAPSGDVVEGVATGTDANGKPIIQTNNGGELTVDSSDFLGAGETTQVSVSGGSAQINRGGVAGAIPQAVASGVRFLFRLAAPVIGSDFERVGALWLHEVSSELVNGYVKGVLYLWSSNNGWVQVGGPQSETNGYIEAPAEGNTYPIISSATYSSTITSLSITVGGASVSTTVLNDTNLTVGNTTVTLSGGIGSVVGVGGTLTLTTTASDETAIAFTVGYG